MLGSIGESLFRVNQERHDQGLDPEGKAWEPLAASTIAAGDRKGGPLNKTGRMLANFHYQVQGDNLRLGFDQGDGFKAIFHQDGSRAHVITARKAKALSFGGIFRKRMNHPGLPARPLVGFPESDRQLVGDVLGQPPASLVIENAEKSGVLLAKRYCRREKFARKHFSVYAEDVLLSRMRSPGYDRPPWPRRGQRQQPGSVPDCPLRRSSIWRRRRSR